MNILVTGGAGYIGSHTAKVLAQSGFQPVNIFYRLVSKDGCGDVCGLEEVT